MTPKKTAKEISDIFIEQIEARLGNVPLLPKAFCRVLAKVLGLVFVGLFQFGSFIILQFMPEFASDMPIAVGGITFSPLQKWGEQFGIVKGQGSRAEAEIEIDVLSTGGTLLSGTQLIRTATQELYFTIGDVALSSSTVTALVRSSEFSELANLENGMTLEFVTPPSEIEKTATVTNVTVQGADPELTEVYRDRILQYMSAKPQGDAVADYWAWATNVDGCIDAFPYSGPTPGVATSGPGQVDVYIQSSTGDGTASPALVTAVQDNIEMTQPTGLADRRGINSFVNVASIYIDTVDVVVNGLNPDTSENRAIISEAIEGYINTRKNSIGGLSRLPRNDFVSVSTVGGVAGQAAASNGAMLSHVTLSKTSGGFSVYNLAEGEQFRLGTITWA